MAENFDNRRLDAGRLTRRVAILRRGTVDDGYSAGAPGTLKRLCWRFVSLKPTRRREFLEVGEVRSYAEYSAWMRFDGVTRTILATDLAWYGGKTFQITAAPMEIGQQAGIELLLVTATDQQVIDPDALTQWT